MEDYSNIPKHIREFCSWEQPYQPIDDDLFIQAMREITQWHSKHNEWYANYLKLYQIDIDVLTTIQDFVNLPPIHANFFKYHEIKSIDEKEVKLHLTSSGTTGQKSQIFFDDFTIIHARKMVEASFKARGVYSDQLTNYLANAYEPYSGFKVGTSNTNQFLMSFAPVAETFWSLRVVAENQHEYDAFGTIETLKKYAKSPHPTRIIGFPAFLHFALQRMQKIGMEPLKLPAGSLIIFGGGWKGHADQAIPKEELLENINYWLGIPKTHVVETFGSVEHSIPYIGCSEQHLHVPAWSKVIIRNVKSLEPMPYGQVGFLSFLSPYITSAPAHSVVMGDLAKLHPENSCNCGNPTEWFEVIGRAGTSSNKSCAAAAAEVLAGQ